MITLNVNNIEKKKINAMIYLEVVKYYNKINHYFGCLLNLMEILQNSHKKLVSIIIIIMDY